MSSIKVQVDNETSPYHAKLEQWTSKEMQLNVLHEEIINKREALLRTSKNFLYGPARADLPLNNTDAAIRNDRLRKDINNLDAVLMEQLMEPTSPRFSNLQANYWSMVSNMFPIWEKTVSEAPTGMNKSKSAGSSRETTFADLAHV